MPGIDVQLVGLVIAGFGVAWAAAALGWWLGFLCRQVE